MLSRLLNFPKNVLFKILSLFSIHGLLGLKDRIIKLISFTLLLILYLFDKVVIQRTLSLPLLPKSLIAKFLSIDSRFYFSCLKLLDKQTGSISRIDLIELSLRSLRAKKTRTIITIGGMSIGIGAIVFLVSIGYGLQKLVISRVARLEELKQTDVYPQTGGQVKITDKTLSQFKEVENVSSVQPVIAVVGVVNYQNSVSDMAVYGVTADYLKESDIKPVEGKIFDSNNLAFVIPQEPGEVAGVSTSAVPSTTSAPNQGQKVDDILYSIPPDQWIRVRESPDTKAKILGYTRREEGSQSASEVWGSSYPDTESGKASQDPNHNWLGKWISDTVPLWQEEVCQTDNPDCEGGKHLVLRGTNGIQAQKAGYFAEVNISLSQSSSPTFTPAENASVLGLSTDSSSPDASSSATTGDFVEIASESATVTDNATQKVSLPASSVRQAIVNVAMLKILSITPGEAVGKTFDAAFVATGDLLGDNKDRVESNPTTYTIVGVTSDDKTPVFYVPFIDLRGLGVVNYSEIKVATKDSQNLAKVRRQIEAEGFLTRSVADTVSQINSLFSTVRAVLALLGTVALIVAALGMFNTLTVSLLERTREVGLMKAMGMKSSEIKELFLTESMIMGLFGGLLGIFFGFVAGKALGLLLSIFSVIKGVGYIDVSFLPLSFLLLVVGLSLIVGVVTGFYPAHRATKISALNALRYE